MQNLAHPLANKVRDHDEAGRIEHVYELVALRERSKSVDAERSVDRSCAQPLRGLVIVRFLAQARGCESDLPRLRRTRVRPDVARADVLRRYKRGWTNFLEVYRPWADHYTVYHENCWNEAHDH
jgi:hypothetical protein